MVIVGPDTCVCITAPVGTVRSMVDLSRERVEYDAGVWGAVRTGAGFAAAGLVFLLTATIWVGTCTGSTADAIACGAPQRAALALGAPAILLAGGVWSLARGLRARRDQSVWLATGALLLVLTVVCAYLVTTLH